MGGSWEEEDRSRTMGHLVGSWWRGLGRQALITQLWSLQPQPFLFSAEIPRGAGDGWGMGSPLISFFRCLQS